MLDTNFPFKLVLTVTTRPRCPGCGNLLLAPTTLFRFGLAMCSGPECGIECKARKIMAKSYEKECVRNFSDVRGARFWTPRDVTGDHICAFNHVYPLPGTEGESHPNTQLNEKSDGEVWVQNERLFEE